MSVERKFLNEPEQKELAQEIIEKFEAFLEARDITIINPEKEESEEPSTIYGTDYGELEQGILDVLIGYGLIKDFRF